MEREKHGQLHRVSKRSSTKSPLDCRGRVTYCAPRFAGKTIKYTVSEDATKSDACKMKYAALQRKLIPELSCARIERGACKRRVVTTTGSKGDVSRLSRSSAELGQTINPRPRYADRKERMTDIHPPRLQFADPNRSRPPTSYYVVKCAYCAREFTGRYALDNFSRHIRQEHGVLHVGPESSCRVCKQGFHRDDDRRKHEWKKHHLQDSRPLQPNHKAGRLHPSIFGGTRVNQGVSTGGLFDKGLLETDYGNPLHLSDTAGLPHVFHYPPSLQGLPPPFDPNVSALFNLDFPDFENLYGAPKTSIPGYRSGVNHTLNHNKMATGEDGSTLLNCHKIWDKLSAREDFKDGTIDIDDLCSKLRAKARLSDSGVVVDHKDVEAALNRLPKEAIRA